MFLFHSVSYCPNILFTIIVNMFFEIKFLSRFSRSSVGDESVGKELKIIYHIFKRLITIVLIVSPEFFVGLKSGTLSQLFHWEFQRLEAYIPPENIKMLYKQVDIPSGYLNDNTVTNTLNNSGYAYNVNAVLGNR